MEIVPQESSEEVGKVNVSETTYQLTKELFNFEYRGKIAVKEKGAINMYFAEYLS
jgi:adenylate cyclase